MSYDLSIAQDRRTAAQFASSSPTPSAGQLCIETDTGWCKVGDGSTAYRLLMPFRLSGEERQSADDVYAAMALSDSRDDGGAADYKEYVAIVSQSGTDAPTATVLANTLGGVPVFSRFGIGQYFLTLSGAFAGSVAFIQVGPANGAAGYYAEKQNDNAVAIYSYSDAAASTVADGVLSSTTVAIRVYS